MNDFDAIAERRRQEQQAANDRLMLSLVVTETISREHRDKQDALWRADGQRQRDIARQKELQGDILVRDGGLKPKESSRVLPVLELGAGIFLAVGICVAAIIGIGKGLDAAATKMGFIAAGTSLFSDKKPAPVRPASSTGSYQYFYIDPVKRAQQAAQASACKSFDVATNAKPETKPAAGHAPKRAAVPPKCDLR